MSPILLVWYVTTFVDTLLAIAGAAVGLLAFMRGRLRQTRTILPVSARRTRGWL